MLKKISKSRSRPHAGRFVIVASRYNARFVDSMLRAARQELELSGAESITVVRVPGVFEIPVVAAGIARRRQSEVSAIICLGVVLRGATTHAEHIGKAVTDALVRIQIEREIPVIHEVLLLENRRQAEERCLDPERNRGREAAQTAVAMAKVMITLDS